MDRFFVTVYTNKGYSGAISIQQGLRSIGIESGITQGGLSVWGPWSQYEAFALEVDRHEGAAFLGGESVHRQPFDVEQYAINNLASGVH